jgi:sugar-specific transcriptional regulator TrmB
MLEQFGFTPTESSVYRALLTIGPSTGYAVAREIGVARANVYQALESLTRRGAAQKAASDPIIYSAAGPAAIAGALEREFRRDLSDLEEKLREVPMTSSRGRAELELLTSTDQLLARAASCVDAAAVELLAVSGPWAGPMHDRLASAVQRRVQVKLVSLHDSGPDGAVLRPVPEAELRSYWGGLPVAVLADKGRSVFGVIQDPQRASGIATGAPGVIPFLRHLLRREIAGS